MKKKYKIGDIVRSKHVFRDMSSNTQLWAILYVGTKHGATPWMRCRNLLNGEEKWFLGHPDWELVA